MDLGDDDEDDDAPLTADSMVPFAWLSFPKEFFASVIDGLNGGGIVDFTPGDGNMAMAAVEANKAYFGYCHTEKRCVLLYDRLRQLVRRAMAQEGNPLYTPAYVQAMRGGGRRTTTTPAPSASQTQKDKKDKKDMKDKKGKDKKDKKTQKKVKDTKKAKSSSSSSSAPPSGDEEDDEESSDV